MQPQWDESIGSFPYIRPQFLSLDDGRRILVFLMETSTALSLKVVKKYSWKV